MTIAAVRSAHGTSTRKVSSKISSLPANSGMSLMLNSDLLWGALVRIVIVEFGPVFFQSQHEEGYY